MRLTERCADILLSVYEEIQEADKNAEDGADKVGEELAVPFLKLTEYVSFSFTLRVPSDIFLRRSFKAVHVLLQKQVHRPFLKRYLKRDDILKSVNACDVALSDALGMFSVCIFNYCAMKKEINIFVLVAQHPDSNSSSTSGL